MAKSKKSKKPKFTVVLEDLGVRYVQAADRGEAIRAARVEGCIELNETGDADHPDGVECERCECAYPVIAVFAGWVEEVRG